MGHGSGARECERVEGMRHVALVYGRGRRADIADLAVYHARAATEVGRPLLSALVATDPNPGHCSHRFNRYSLSALGSFPKTPGRVSRPMPRYLGVLARYPLT